MEKNNLSVCQLYVLAAKVFLKWGLEPESAGDITSGVLVQCCLWTPSDWLPGCDSVR